MFYAPKEFSVTQNLIWAYITYTIYGTAYAFINIPYGSLSSVMTQDPIERSGLSVARGVGAMIANVLPRILVPLVLVQFAEDLAKGYLIAMILFGIIAFVSYIICYFTVEENVEQKIQETKEDEKVSLKSSFRQLAKNKPFIALSIASLGMMFGMLVNQAMSVYYFGENLNALGLLSITGITSLILTIILAPISTKIVSKYGVKKTVSVSSLVSALVWGMVSDCIDYNSYIGGVRQEGIIYGSYSFVRKLGQAIAGFASGIGLTIIGYNASVAVQSTVTLFGIKLLTIGLPAIGMGIAFLAFQFMWNITPEIQKEMSKKNN